MKKSLRERERAFDAGSPVACRKSLIPDYNALVDPNMCHFFESRTVQSHLLRTGQIDLTGRVVSFDKNRFKLNILEKEFERAELDQLRRSSEEQEIRYRIQRRRVMELERARKEELISGIRKEKQFTREILHTLRPQTSTASSSKSGGHSRIQRRDDVEDE